MYSLHVFVLYDNSNLDSNPQSVFFSMYTLHNYIYMCQFFCPPPPPPNIILKNSHFLHIKVTINFSYSFYISSQIQNTAYISLTLECHEFFHANVPTITCFMQLKLSVVNECSSNDLFCFCPCYFPPLEKNKINKND